MQRLSKPEKDGHVIEGVADVTHLTSLSRCLLLNKDLRGNTDDVNEKAPDAKLINDTYTALTIFAESKPKPKTGVKQSHDLKKPDKPMAKPT